MRASSKRFTALWKEITIVLVIKVVLLLVMWKVFFNDPLEKHLTVAHMQQQWLGSSS